MKKSLNINEEDLTKNIKDIRKEKGLTQFEVSEVMGYSRSLYARIESGLTSTIPYLDKLVDVLGEEVAEIFPYDINKYTNHRLLLYMIIFGENYNVIAEKLKLKEKQVKKIMLNPRKRYLLQYKDEIELLFPNIDKFQYYQDFEIVGKNSLRIKINGEQILLLNILGNKCKDAIFDLYNELE
jgi:transcriptional regulator with XRE-family HTH domain